MLFQGVAFRAGNAVVNSVTLRTLVDNPADVDAGRAEPRPVIDGSRMEHPGDKRGHHAHVVAAQAVHISPAIRDNLRAMHTLIYGEGERGRTQDED